MEKCNDDEKDNDEDVIAEKIGEKKACTIQKVTSVLSSASFPLLSEKMQMLFAERWDILYFLFFYCSASQSAYNCIL